MKRLGGLIYSLFCLCTAIIGHTIHHSVFWSILDFFFMPLTWFKWLICQEVTLSIIKNSFNWFLQ